MSTQKKNDLITHIRQAALSTIVSASGKARILSAQKSRRLATLDPALLTVDEARTWINLLLTAAGREDLLLPTDTQFDAAGLRTRMDAVIQSIQADVKDATTAEATPTTEMSPDAMQLANRQRGGKVRQMSAADIRSAARRIAGIPSR